MNLFSKLHSKLGYYLIFAVIASLVGVSHATPIECTALHGVNQATLHKNHCSPINLARWHRGASLVLVKKEGLQRITMPEIADYEESILLSSNSALAYKISSGTHDFIIDLGGPMHVSRVFVNNQSASGQLSLLASNTLENVDNEKWKPLSPSIAFSSGVIPSVTFPETKTRYMLLRFDINDGGTIGNLGATGPLYNTQASAFDSLHLKAD